MEVFFKKRRLQEMCSNRRMLISEYGADNAKKIMMRLNEFASVENLFRISELPPPRKEDGSIDYERITRVLILEVEDYHGK